MYLYGIDFRKENDIEEILSDFLKKKEQEKEAKEEQPEPYLNLSQDEAE